jgi:carboxylesterase
MHSSTPNPAADYAEALRRIQSDRAGDQAGEVRPVCLPRVMEHGAATEWAVVILHGFSTCPEQFQELGERLFDLGFNIYIPRQPYHGLADRTANNLAPLTAERLAAYGDQALDIGRGLGRKVLLIGLSGGGTVAAWLAQNRPDLEIAMPIAPMLGVSFIPSAFTRPFAWLFNQIPDFYMWWDPRNKAENPYAVDYSYPGYSIRAMSECLKLGVWVRRQARSAAPKAYRIVMVINDNEPGVNNKEVYKVMADWQAHQNHTRLGAFHFEKSLKLPHDLITPGTPGLDIETVYRLLIGRIVEETRDATG